MITNVILNKGQKKILKTSAIIASAVIPAVYMTKLHVDMFKKEDTPNRVMMGNKMLGFFAGIGLSVLLVHRRVSIGGIKILKPANTFSKQVTRIILAGIAPFAGLRIAKEINKKLYPDMF